MKTATLLLIPLVEIQFSDQVNWTGEDFVVAGALLLAAGFVLNMIVGKVRNKHRKILALGVLAVVFLYV